MQRSEPIKLSRDCEAIQIPAGTKVILRAGATVSVSQSLGGNFTVVTEDGYMARIVGKDADALGVGVPVEAKAPPSSEGSVEKLVWDQIKTCYDPEIPVNIADLGLIYDCKAKPIQEGKYRVEIKMTLTAPGCGMGSVIAAEVQSKVLTVPGVKEADIELVWEPPWNPSMMSEAAKLQLGMV